QSPSTRDPNGERMRVVSPSLAFAMPLANQFLLSASLVHDAMSGASPTYHSALSGASGKGVHDKRNAGDVKLAWYRSQQMFSLGFAASRENDYSARSYSFGFAQSTADKNTTLQLGLALNRDVISSVNHVADHEQKNGHEVLIALTHNWNEYTLLQASLSYGKAKGYFNDPYKVLDSRPNQKEQGSVLLRANHFLPSAHAAVNLSYRYYQDTFGIRAHTLSAAWQQHVGEDWVISPGLRYYTQSKADFYFDPPFMSGYVNGQTYSTDQRLSNFYGLTYGLGLSKQLSNAVSLNGKYEYSDHKMRSPGLLPMRLQLFTVGAQYRF
ncbi:MAG: hypothetical protein RLZZ502_117, partial [Pseudomonadota bacterium]